MTVWPAAAAQDSEPPAEGEAERRFAQAVDAAVDRGLKRLQALQNPDGGYGVYHFHSGRDYVAGQTALALLARIASGENPHTESIRKGFAHLLAHPPIYTYELGLTLMAFDKRAAPVGERLALERMSKKERERYEWPRHLDEGEREYLRVLVERLQGEAWNGCWSYGAKDAATTLEKADVSNTQYAILGLCAASRCGLEIDHALLAESLEYFVQHQEKSGPKVRFIDVEVKADGARKQTKRTLRARSWGYDHGSTGGDQVSAARTNIGIACLLLPLDELLENGKGRPKALARKLEGDVEEAVLDGLAWLDQNFSVETNPPGEPEESYFYYYLYSLERTGQLTGRRFIGEHDWYREGAEHLLKLQLPSGGWPGHGWDNELVNTSFALLFLRRATLPGPRTRQ